MQHLPELARFVDQALPASVRGLRVLDLGCGLGWGSTIVRLHSGGDQATITGIEVHEYYAQRARSLGTYDSVITTDLRHCEIALEAFDLVLLIDVIEHLPRAWGLAILDRCRHNRGLHVVLSTPNGNDLRGPQGGVQSEAHVSSWKVQAFRSRGFKVMGLGLRGLPLQSKLGVLGVYWGTPLSLKLPKLAATLLAVRRATL